MLTSIWEYGTQRGDNVLTQDYLMRMFMQLAAAMKESLLRARGENDPRVAADMLDAAILMRRRWTVASFVHGARINGSNAAALAA